MATYGTDLTLLADADSATNFTLEFTDAASGGTPAADGENYIQGVNCVSQTTGTKSGLKSIVYNAAANQSGNITTNEVVLMWLFYAIGPNIQPFASAGYRIGIGASQANVDLWNVGGGDFGRNPYGGWFNAAVDPRKTPTSTFGTGSGGVWQYFGAVVDTINPISKGTPHAVDAIRYGRGEIYCTGTGCEFTTMAQYNDYNQASAHPNSGDANGYNRFGLFSKQGGIFLWKGMMAIGLTGTSATFSDANKTITIDDTPAVTSTFNKIEIRNASTSCTWDSITFLSLGTTSRGNFEMIANATVSQTGCTFTDMGTFIYQSNATCTGNTYRRCQTVTPAGGTFTDCLFVNTQSTTGAITIAAPSDIANMSNCNFTNNTIGPAIRITAAGTYSFIGHQFSGNTVQVEFTGTGTCTINPSGGSNVNQANVTATGGGTIVVNTPQVNLTLTGLKSDSEVRAYTGTNPATATEIGGVESSGTSFTFGHTSGGQAGYIQIFHVEYQPVFISLTYSSLDQTIPIQQITDRQYARGTTFTPT